MADYTNLPQVTVTATKDTTGRNTGNYTNAFNSTVPNWPIISQFEIYHMTITNAALLNSATIYLRNNLYSTVSVDLSGNNEYDPQQPPIVNSGDELDFFWNVTAGGSNPAPEVTIWCRYDASLPRNRQQV